MDITDPGIAGKPLSRWQTFTAAPHRVMLFGGAVQLVLVMGYWLTELGLRANGMTLPTSIPGVWAHTALMLYGIFIFFMFGFLMTVYPRWMATNLVARAGYVPTFVLLVAGIVLFYIGLFMSSTLVVFGACLMLIGWANGYVALLRVYRGTQKRHDREHETLINFALAAGWLGFASFAAAVALGAPALFAFARIAGIWLFLLPILFTVGHRMIPFFSASALNPVAPYKMVRPRWSLYVMIGGAVIHATLELLQLGRWTFLVDAPLFLTALYHTIAWRFFRSLNARMLAMLHIAFLWLTVALALYFLQSLTLFVTGDLIMPRAPLHALGIGFFACLSMGMVTRVTLGHSGNPMVATNRTWFSFLGLNAVVLLRITAELPLSGNASATLNIVAGAGWLLVLVPWVASIVPIYLKPRTDGARG